LAEGDVARLDRLAAELVADEIDVIVAIDNSAIRRLRVDDSSESRRRRGGFQSPLGETAEGCTCYASLPSTIQPS
jgi:hypothetical protein